MIDLELLLSYENPRTSQYAELFGIGFDCTNKFSAHLTLVQGDSKLTRALRKKARGKIMIDLGCGYYISTMVLAASHLQMPAYIGVELNNPIRRDLIPNVPKLEIALLEKTDMLKFMSRLQRGSYGFVLNGIDSCVIDNYLYQKALKEEIARAAESGSIIFGTRSFIQSIGRGFRVLKYDLSGLATGFLLEKE